MFKMWNKYRKLRAGIILQSNVLYDSRICICNKIPRKKYRLVWHFLTLQTLVSSAVRELQPPNEMIRLTEICYATYAQVSVFCFFKNKWNHTAGQSVSCDIPLWENQWRSEAESELLARMLSEWVRKTMASIVICWPSNQTNHHWTTEICLSFEYYIVSALKEQGWCTKNLENVYFWK